MLNIKLNNLKCDATLFPQIQTMTDCFIRGNTIRYVSMAENNIDVQLLHDATLLELNEIKSKQ
ncbi:U6 snRNA-associated Sm family protein LSm2, putative [Entamoeba histolytica HM-1:IMSS-B]|uniref:U6 snRNA-associated Sm-like protein LSm2, putative n=8 Tax=Entamoeba TaxID=5758 RepID=C4LU49_ENTH1|nr:U6 snRNA-associated Sm family protein LSm2, putative [Entamoeba nuttalli P19]XP_654174.2 U6 snRNA-associated Sm-like protein LSm2, putative [Entamoeba histolytica HM-1:IMSS]EMD44870.1 U6 snrnaassociated Sm family LSm2 protein, putative [Entamoeba histolytica KU27]EMH76078.1 U6 snRNA-associated Sm family protein LSm2, putative [Entamoeba histolytica HM-1:IMSS-B]EMS15527.1 U6 snRNA-associated Sm family protein LSm2, putative [Entamoeba histolytica HM-3:IMSS]ENY65914.1 U6 snRNA-associated Sm f|eukprot:XP_008859023.1 U6 snRNA-associated Sm family protein LSm2, putative [Entamoeba nuttalli P19]